MEQGTPLVDTERPPTFENLVIRHMPASTRAAPATYGKLTVAVVAPPDRENIATLGLDNRPRDQETGGHRAPAISDNATGDCSARGPVDTRAADGRPDANGTCAGRVGTPADHESSSGATDDYGDQETEVETDQGAREAHQETKELRPRRAGGAWWRRRASSLLTEGGTAGGRGQAPHVVTE